MQLRQIEAGDDGQQDLASTQQALVDVNQPGVLSQTQEPVQGKEQERAPSDAPHLHCPSTSDIFVAARDIATASEANGSSKDPEGTLQRPEAESVQEVPDPVEEAFAEVEQVNETDEEINSRETHPERRGPEENETEDSDFEDTNSEQKVEQPVGESATEFPMPHDLRLKQVEPDITSEEPVEAAQFQQMLVRPASSESRSSSSARGSMPAVPRVPVAKTQPRPSQQKVLQNFWGQVDPSSTSDEPQAQIRRRHRTTLPVHISGQADKTAGPECTSECDVSLPSALALAPTGQPRDKGKRRARASLPMAGPEPESDSSLTPPPPELPKRSHTAASSKPASSGPHHANGRASERPNKRARLTDTSPAAPSAAASSKRRQSEPESSQGVRRTPARAQNVAAFQRQVRGFRDDYGMAQKHVLYWLGSDMNIPWARERIEMMFIDRLQERCDLRRADLIHIFSDVKGDPVAFDVRLAADSDPQPTLENGVGGLSGFAVSPPGKRRRLMRSERP